MTTRRAFLVALGAGALAAPFPALAQQAPRRIGFLGARSRSTSSNPDVYVDAFVLGMRELGYVEGRNLVIEWRFADGKDERLPALAAELVRANVELIVTHTTPGTQAAQRVTRTIPIVMANANDPIGSGFAASLARPGGNITGLSNVSVDLSPKYLELLRIMVPALSRVAVLVNPDNSTHQPILKGIQTVAQRIGVKIMPVAAHAPEEIERGFARMSRDRADAVIISSDSIFLTQARQIAGLAAKARLPTMFWSVLQVEAGGLMSYGQNYAELYHRAATYVDKILKGARPGDLPIEQPTIFELAINRKTAKALRLAIPKELLLRADRVIE